MISVIALALCIVLTLASQLAQKQVAIDVHRAQAQGRSDVTYFSRPLFWFALISLGLAMLGWLVVLRDYEVSKAYPLLSLNYALVLLASRVVFHERIPPLRWLGVLVICSGIAVVAGS